MKNEYAGIVDDWKVKLIKSRVRKLGFRGQDIDDAVQEVVLRVLKFEFDPQRAHGQSERAVLTCLVDRTLKSLRRKEARYRQKLEEVQAELGFDAPDAGEPSYSIPLELMGDVASAMAALPPVAQEICRHLAGGASVREVARRLEVDWHTVKHWMERIREHFAALGLDEYVPDRLAEGDADATPPVPSAPLASVDNTPWLPSRSTQ